MAYPRRSVARIGGASVVEGFGADVHRVVERAAQVLAGVVLLGLGLLFFVMSVVASGAAIVDRRERAMLWWAVPCAFVTAHVVFWAGRLVLGRPRRDGGLMPPGWILVFGLLIVSAAPLSLATGAYRAGGIPLLVVVPLAAVSPFAVYGLWVMVARKKRNSRAPDRSPTRPRP